DTNLEQTRRLTAQEISSFEITNRFIGKHGKLIWVHKHVSVLRDAQGSPASIIALITDVTERRQQEEQIRESKDKLQLALSAAQLGTWRWEISKGAGALQCDARCRMLFGLNPGAEITNEILVNAIEPHDRAQAKQAAVRALNPADPCD